LKIGYPYEKANPEKSGLRKTSGSKADKAMNARLLRDLIICNIINPFVSGPSAAKAGRS